MPVEGISQGYLRRVKFSLKEVDWDIRDKHQRQNLLHWARCWDKAGVSSQKSQWKQKRPFWISMQGKQALEVAEAIYVKDIWLHSVTKFVFKSQGFGDSFLNKKKGVEAAGKREVYAGIEMATYYCIWHSKTRLPLNMRGSIQLPKLISVKRPILHGMSLIFLKSLWWLPCMKWTFFHSRKESPLGVRSQNGLSPTHTHPWSSYIHFDWFPDAIAMRPEAMSLLPAHFLEHLEPDILLRQFLLHELHVLGLLLQRLPSKWGKREAKISFWFCDRILEPAPRMAMQESLGGAGWDVATSRMQLENAWEKKTSICYWDKNPVFIFSPSWSTVMDFWTSKLTQGQRTTKKLSMGGGGCPGSSHVPVLRLENHPFLQLTSRS